MPCVFALDNPPLLARTTLINPLKSISKGTSSVKPSVPPPCAEFDLSRNSMATETTELRSPRSFKLSGGIDGMAGNSPWGHKESDMTVSEYSTWKIKPLWDAH